MSPGDRTRIKPRPCLDRNKELIFFKTFLKEYVMTITIVLLYKVKKYNIFN